MMRLLTAIIISFTLLACTLQGDKGISASGWKGLEDKFRYKNLQHFVIDTAFINSYYNRGDVYKAFLTPKDEYLDSLLAQKNYYLYSWEAMNTSLTALTIVVETLGEALEMRYIIFDKADRLLSDFVVANSGAEPGGYNYRTESYRSSPATITTTRTRSFKVDQNTLEPLTKPINDTMIFQQSVAKNGTVSEVRIDSSIHSRKYIDKQGRITQQMIDKAINVNNPNR